MKSISIKQQFLAFDLAEDLHCMTSTEFLLEVTTFRVEQILPILNLPQMVMGLSNYRSEILSIIDLPALLGLPGFYTKREQQFFNTIVVKHNSKIAGLAVPYIGQLFHAKPTEMQTSYPQRIPNALRKCTSNTYHPIKGKDMLVIDLGQLFAILENKRAIEL
ncbi:MAG TPA: chemotaxis protein CheW [Xenococcaceae cyanobacterium]